MALARALATTPRLLLLDEPLTSLDVETASDIRSLLRDKNLRHAGISRNGNDVDAVAGRARALWDSVYAPFEDKLVEKLARAHPDLPVHILNSHYGPLLSDPPPAQETGNESGSGTALARTGRVLTSAVAVACLRAQTGVGPQVLSHVFGLRKAWEDGSWRGDAEAGVVDEETVRWLAGDEGCEWLLRSVDGIVEALGGSTFAGANARELKL